VVHPLEAPGPRPAVRALRLVPAGADAAHVTMGTPCSCGHGKQAHEHYRRGSDCALCPCRRFSRGLLARLGLRAG
jgi:hypothetical protein